MKSEDVKLGMDVRISHGSKYETYQVMELPDSDGNLLIAYKEDGELYSSNYCNVGNLEPIDQEARAVAIAKAQEKINEATSAFEKAFAALHAAYDIGSESGLMVRGNREMFSLGELEGVIDQNGWSSSSLHC